MPEEITKIGRYDIVSELGRGAMGIVYKGHDPGIDRFVAIKTLARNILEVDDGQLEERFRTEAKAAGRLTHPNIISIYEFGEDAQRAFIAMEYVEGCTLSQLEKRGTLLEVARILAIMRKVLDALQYAHERGIVHRDIKPSNIMYTPQGDVKIADFGIARLESSTQTQFGTVIGTPGYMSPEQIMGQRVDHRSDIFSAGVLLYELLTGERAFVSTNITSTTYKVVNTELPPPSKLCPTVPEAVDAVLARALAKRPDDRYQSAQEFAQALASIRTGGMASAAAQAPLPPCDDTVIQPRTDAGAHAAATVLASSTTGESLPPIATGAGVATPPEAGVGPDADSAPRREPAAYDYPASAVQEVREPDSDIRPARANGAQRQADKAGTAGGGRRWLVGAGLALVATVAAVLVMMRFPFLDTPGRDAGSTDNPDVPAARDTRDAATDHPPGRIFSDCSACPTMIVLAPGTFRQGTLEAASEREPAEVPQHEVSIAYPLAIGVKEVTRGQYSRFVLETGYRGDGCWVYDGEWRKSPAGNWLSPGFFQDDNHPVTCVSWEDAQAYAGWLSKKTGHGYRLPSESEWEYAARAGTGTARSWGDDPGEACTAANVADNSVAGKYPGWDVYGCSDNYVYTAPAGLFAANGFGVHDTLGNVFEWVEDCWNDGYAGAPADGSAWSAGDCGRRVLRGGSWYSRPEFVRSAYRNRFPPDHRSSSFGFRIARELEAG